MERNIRVSAVQFEHTAGDKTVNIEKIQRFVEEAAREDVEIIVFPECCVTGYWFLRKLDRARLLELAEPIPSGPSSQTLLGLADKHKITVGAGLLELGDDDRIYNSYLVAMCDGSWRCHRKIHAFINKEVSCGDTYTVFDTPHGCRAAVLICYDNNLIENARTVSLMGAEVLLAPHQTGGCASRSPHAMGLIDPKVWEERYTNPQSIESEIRGPKGRGWLMRWLPARAHDNGLFLIFSNGIGVDDDEIRTGNAMIIDCYGRILKETWKAGDDRVTSDLDAALLPTCTGRRWLRARRPELYALLGEQTGSEKPTREVRLGE